MIAISVVAAILAGSCFAMGNVLQQAAASRRPQHEALSFRLLASLLREPVWLGGIGLSIFSFVMQSIALAFGPLVLVQPLIATELLIALPVAMRRHERRLTAREWLGAGAVVTGLSAGLVCSSPGEGHTGAPLTHWGVALAAGSFLVAVAVVVGRAQRGPRRASSYAFGAAVAFGTQAALLKTTIFLFERGVVTALTSWQPWAMATISILGLLLLQSAFQAGPLAASMPVEDAVEPAVAVALGVALFHETVRTGAWLVGVGVGALCLVGGIVLLDTSPLVQSVFESHHGSG